MFIILILQVIEININILLMPHYPSFKSQIYGMLLRASADLSTATQTASNAVAADKNTAEAALESAKDNYIVAYLRYDGYLKIESKANELKKSEESEANELKKREESEER